MIRHCVFIKFRHEIPSADKKQIYKEISALQGRQKGVSAIHVGDNVSPEAGMDKGFAEGFIVDFEDAAARDRYLQDTEHQKTGAKIIAAAENGLAGIFVYDLEI